MIRRNILGLSEVADKKQPAIETLKKSSKH